MAAKQHFSVWLLVPEPQRATVVAAMKAAADTHGLATSEPHITLLGDAGAGTEAEMTAKLAALAGIGAVPCNFAKSGAVTAGIGADGTVPWNQSAVAVPAPTPELSRAHRTARQAFHGDSVESIAVDAWASPIRQPHLSLAYGNPPELVATLDTPPDYVTDTAAVYSCTPPTLAGVPNWRRAALTLLLAAVLRRYYEVVSLLSAPADHLSDPLPPGIGVDGIEAYLSERDERAGPLQPGVSSCVRWAGRRGAATDVAVVFLHGWSASPEEIDPADAEIAMQLGANLVRVRLSGHGLAPPERAGRGLCEKAKCGELLRDAAVSLALGRLAGRRVVLVGCSTGGTLAVWLACQAWARPALAALVLVSPGFALSLAGRAYALFKWPALLLPLPAATRLVHCVAGRTHHVPFVSEEQARVCTMAYPSESVVNLCAVYTSVQLADVAAIGRARLPTLVFANPADPVVSYAAMRCQLAAAAAEFVDVLDSEEPHVITGRIYSPSTVARVVDRASAFLGRALGEAARNDGRGRLSLRD